MNRRELLLGALAATAALVAVPASAKKKWTKLYNGRDLTGWHVKDGNIAAWGANGEMISSRGSGGGGWLTSDKEYGDFVLRLEYRIPAGGNSGVGIRYPAAGDPAHVGMEIQVLDDNAPDYRNLNPAQYNGGIYYQSAPKARPAKAPGQWNKYEIRCQGPRVIVKLNGVEIQNINMDEFTRGEGGQMALAQRPRRGFIGFQHHGHQVDFRKIEIKEL
jgi:hypothetical protein